MASFEQYNTSRVRKCSICSDTGHNKRTCSINNFVSLSPSETIKGQRMKPSLKQQIFLAEDTVIDLVHQIMDKGFFPSKSEFYRHCVLNELEHWFDLKELLQEDE